MAKGWLDGLIGLTIVLLYQKQVISMAFHEVAGLLLFGLFVGHLALNWRWIAGVSRRLFDRTIPTKTRVGYALNGLLLVCWTLVIASGVLISKQLFSFRVNGPWKVVHYAGAAVALALVGLHVGLHWGWIRGALRRWGRPLGVLGKPLGALCLAVLLGLGMYSLSVTSYVRWLSMPFSVGVEGRRPERMEARQGEAPAPEQIGMAEGDQAANPAGGQETGGEGQREGRQGGGFSWGNLAWVVISFGSILTVFAAFSALLDRLLRRRLAGARA